MGMSVSDPLAFAADTGAKIAIAGAIAEAAGVDTKSVKVTITVARRLMEAQLRRLAGAVIVNYVITLGADAIASATTVSDNLQAKSTMEMTTIISSKVAAEVGPEKYAVQVTSALAPTVVTGTLTTTTTKAAPVTQNPGRESVACRVACGRSAVAGGLAALLLSL